MSSNSVCNHTRSVIGLPLWGRPILLSLVCLQTELDSTQSYKHYFLNIAHFCCPLTHVFAVGIVQIGKGLQEEAPFSGDAKRSTTLNKSPQSPPRIQETGKLSVSDCVFCSHHMYSMLKVTAVFTFLSITRCDAGTEDDTYFN